MQTRSLLGVFEEDTAAISNYCTQLYQAMQRIYDAQVHTHTHRFTGVVPLALQVWAEQTVIRGSLLESVPPAAQCCLLCSL